MSDDLQRQARRYYSSDILDDWLDHVYPRTGASRFPFGHARALVLDAVLDAHQRQPGIAYDIGCGAGQLALALARRGYRVRAVDFSAPMLSRAAANASSAGLSDRVELIEADFLEAEIVGQDPGVLAIAMGFLEYCPDPTRFFERLRACLAEDALAVVEFRNRLLSATSANAYTIAELEGGELRRLIEQTADAWQERPPSPEDLAEYARALRGSVVDRSAAADPGATILPFPVDRTQHTFQQMRVLGDAHGLDLVEFLALHPHPFAPIVERTAPAQYNAAAWALQQLPRNPLVLMTSSSAAAVYRAAG